MDDHKSEEDHENAKVRNREKENNAGRCRAVAPSPVLLLFFRVAVGSELE